MLDATIVALDKLLESVPQDALNRAKDIVTTLGSDNNNEGGESGSGDGGSVVVDEAELKRLGQLF